MTSLLPERPKTSLCSIFTAEPNLRKHWDVEDIEPDQIAKSRQMQQKGASFLSSLNHLVNNLENEKPFKLECSELRDTYKEMGLKAADVKVRGLSARATEDASNVRFLEVCCWCGRLLRGKSWQIERRPKESVDRIFR